MFGLRIFQCNCPQPAALFDSEFMAQRANKGPLNSQLEKNALPIKWFVEPKFKIPMSVVLNKI